MNKEQLVCAALSGNQKAWERLYYETYPKVHAIAHRMLRDKTEAEDLIQEAYAKACISLAQLNQPERFDPWICTIATNLCKNHLRKQKPLLFTECIECDDDAPFEWTVADTSVHADPESIALDADLRTQLMALIDELPEEQKVCLIEFAINEKKISEIAADMGTTESTVKSRLNYAKKKMVDKITELEKKGVKIYSISGISMLALIQYLFTYNPVTVPTYSASMAGAGAVVTTATTVSGASAGAGSVVASTAVKAGITAGTKMLGVKIAAVIASISLVTGGVILATNPEILSTKAEQPKATEPVQTPSNENNEEQEGNLIDSFSSQDQYKINLFVSGLCQSTLIQYPTTDYELLQFANNYKSTYGEDVIAFGNYYERVPKADVDSILMEVFGKTITPIGEHQLFEPDNPYDITAIYDGGYYYLQPAYPSEGAASVWFAIVDSMYRNEDGTYTIHFNEYLWGLYSPEDPVESMDTYYAYKPKDAEYLAANIIASGTAIIKDHTTTEGKSIYQVLEFSYKHG